MVSKIIKNVPLITQFLMFPLEYFAVKSHEMAIPDFENSKLKKLHSPKISLRLFMGRLVSLPLKLFSKINDSCFKNTLKTTSAQLELEFIGC